MFSKKFSTVFGAMIAVVMFLVDVPGASAKCGAKRVVIDIGHSPKRSGARSARGGREYDFNKRLSLELAPALRKAGFNRTVLLNVAGKEMSLKARTILINRAKPDAMLSIHHDSMQPRYLKPWTYKGKKLRYGDVFSGHSLFVSNRNPVYRQSRLLGEKIGRAFRAGGFKPTLHHAEKIKGENRPLLNPHLGLYRFDGLAVLKRTQAPAVLIEAGIIINRAEEVKLNSPAYRARVVKAIIDGVKAYFGC